MNVSVCVYIYIYMHISFYDGFPGGSVVKNLPASAGDMRCGFNFQIRKIPWRRKWQPTPIILPKESHGQRSLAGCSPQGHKELEMTEQAGTSTIIRRQYVHLNLVYESI